MIENDGGKIYFNGCRAREEVVKRVVLSSHDVSLYTCGCGNSVPAIRRCIASANHELRSATAEPTT